MSELPVVIMMGQRPGPSTGLPTYSSQADLNFVLYSGQGEFSRFVAAPGDLEEAYFWSGEALNLAWKYQIPAFVLTDKNLNEGVFNFTPDCLGTLDEEGPRLWEGNGYYQRYQDTEDGVSPLAFAPRKEAVIKVNSYEHDESGITTEDPVLTKKMQDKRLRKEKFLREDLKKYETVKVHGKTDSSIVLLCWGSNKGAAVEVAGNLGLKVVQPLVLAPLPHEGLRSALEGAEKIICIESNATGQLANLIKIYGMRADELILKYDGRPFAVEELQELVEKIIK
jgi:2-oxoglutarate ferredoxin oxidoreductase subunit alpha